MRKMKETISMERYKQHREFLKANFEILDKVQTDRQKGLPAYPFQKEYDKKAKLIALPDINIRTIKKNNLFDCLELSSLSSGT